MRRALTLAIAAAAASSYLTAPAWADGSSFALRPVKYTPSLPATQSYFIVAAHPGQTIRDMVRVTNEGTTPGTALLYPVDATTGRTSGAVYLSRTSRRRDVGAWLRVSQVKVTLSPHQSVIVPFSVTVPAHVRPGQHLGGLVAENLSLTSGSPTQTGKSKGSFRITIRHLTIVAVEVDLPGPRVSRIALTHIAWARTGTSPTVVLSMRNLGTIMVKPQGTILLKTKSGTIVDRQRFSLDTFLPRTSIDYPLILRKNLEPGSYRAVVRLRPGQGRPRTVVRFLTVAATATSVRSVDSNAPAAAGPAANGSGSTPKKSTDLPWILAGGGLALGLVGIFVAIRSRRRSA